MNPTKSPTHYEKEFTDEIKLSDTLNIEKREPVKVRLEWNQLCASGIVLLIHLGAGLLLLISCVEILWHYWIVINGTILTEAQKSAFDHSIPIFVGSALYHMTYFEKVKKFVQSILRVDSSIQPLAAKEKDP